MERMTFFIFCSRSGLEGGNGNGNGNGIIIEMERLRMAGTSTLIISIFYIQYELSYSVIQYHTVLVDQCPRLTACCLLDSILHES